MNKMIEYISHSNDKKSLFYENNNEGDKIRNMILSFDFNEEEWENFSDRSWNYMIFKHEEFPEQGWKIHITTSLESAKELLFDVSKFLIENRVSFKYVPSIESLIEKNVKYADRSTSAKFITIYPKDVIHFEFLLDALKEITDRFEQGPYILNDRQWKESNVFYRYGALKRITAKINGVDTLCIKDPEGKMIPDKRVPYYYLPDFVEEPSFLKENNTYPSSNSFEKIKEYKITEAIHFSNAGGVYKAQKDGKILVLKEGREGAGLDNKGKDGFHRIKNEFDQLYKLKDVEGVVKVEEYFTSWKNNYFSEEYIEAINLNQFIATSFPYGLKDINAVEEYSEKCISILNQLVSILQNIHKKNIAVGDLSLNNILLSNNDSRVTLIDFEASNSPKAPFELSIATPGFYSNEAKNFLEADWFSLSKISWFLFLPIQPLSDIAPQMRNIHLENIREKFGEKTVNCLMKIDSMVARITNLNPVSPYLEKKLYPPLKKVSLSNLKYTVDNLSKGLVNNLNVDSLSLIKGDIDQYDSYISRYNIKNGAFGVILSLIRAGKVRDILDKKDMDFWLKTVVPGIVKYSYNMDSNISLFNGVLGISTVLFEIGYEKDAMSIINSIDKNKIERIEDISIFNGLSGVGLMLLSVYTNNKDSSLLMTTNIVYEKLITIYKEKSIKKDFGLLTGWTGVALFFWKYGYYFDNVASKEIAVEIIDEALNSSSDYNNNESLYLPNRTGTDIKLFPYIDNGSSGIALTMLEFMKDDKYYLNREREEIFHKLCDTNLIYATVDGGLFSGFAGNIVLGIALKEYKKNPRMLKYLLNNINNYIIRNSEGDLLFPGKYGYKCSMDLATGAAGILSILKDVQRGEWGSWMPLPNNTLKLFKL